MWFLLWIEPMVWLYMTYSNNKVVVGVASLLVMGAIVLAAIGIQKGRH